jgi:hypothetical protein
LSFYFFQIIYTLQIFTLSGLKQSNGLLASAKQSITNGGRKLRREEKKDKEEKGKKRQPKSRQSEGATVSQKVPIPHHSTLHGPEMAKQPMMTSKWGGPIPRP